MANKLARCLCAALLFLVTLPMRSDPQFGRVLTITAGTAIPLVPNAKNVNPVLVDSLFIQALHGGNGGSGIIYILNCNPQDTCSKGNAFTVLVAELSPASSTAPGGWFRFPTNGTGAANSGGTDLRYWLVDGSNSGDTVATSWSIKQ